jgi:hypothetical protein
MAGGGQDNFNGWNRVSYLYAKLGDFSETAEVTRQALQRYDGSPRVDQKFVGQMKDRLLFSSQRLAKAADLAGNAEESAKHWGTVGTLVDGLLKDESSKNDPRIVRLAAEVYGGYVALKEGLPTLFLGQGKYKEARELWDRIEGSQKAQGKSGSPEWWEAKFYSFHSVFRERKADKKPFTDIKKALETLKVVSPEYGGRQWKPYFEWLEREMY